MQSAATVTLENAEVLALLRQAQERNHSIELHKHKATGELLVAKARLIGCDEKFLHLDSPHSIGKNVHFIAGERISVHIVLSEKMYVFNSSIIDAACLVPLNRRRRVEGMRIACPAQMQIAQRREDYRVSVAALDPIPVVVHEAAVDCPDASPIDAVQLSGELVNFSIGGIRARLDVPESHKLTIGHKYYIGFRLPSAAAGSLFLCELRHYASIPGNRGTAVGLQFMNWPDRSVMHQKLETLRAFSFELQRRALQRRR